MKITINREAFLAAFQACAQAVPTSDVKPVLKCVLARVAGGRCTLSATDLEIGVRTSCPVTQHEPGDALLPAAPLLAVLKGAWDDELTVEADNASARVTGDGKSFEVPADDPAHYPDFPAGVPADCYEADGPALVSAVRRTVFAVKPVNADSGRFGATSGLAWEPAEKVVTLIGSDGARLSKVELPILRVGKPAEVAGGLVSLPTRAMKALAGLPAVGPCRFAFFENEAVFTAGDSAVYCRRIEGRYPAWRQVVATRKGTPATLDAAGLGRTIRLAASMATAESLAVTLGFAPGTLTARAAGKGSSAVSMPLDWPGKPVEFRMDPSLLTSLLAVLEGGAAVAIEIVDAEKPLVVRPTGDHFYMAVPMIQRS